MKVDQNKLSNKSLFNSKNILLAPNDERKAGYLGIPKNLNLQQASIENKHLVFFDQTFGKLQISDIKEGSLLNPNESIDSANVRNFSFQNLEQYINAFSQQNQKSQGNQIKKKCQKHANNRYFQYFKTFQKILTSLKQQLYNIKKIINKQLQKSKKIYNQQLENLKEHMYKLTQTIIQEKQQKLQLIKSYQSQIKQRQKYELKIKQKLFQCQQKYIQTMKERSKQNLAFSQELKNLSEQNVVNAKQKQGLLKIIEQLNEKIIQMQNQSPKKVNPAPKYQQNHYQRSNLLLSKRLELITNSKVTSKFPSRQNLLDQSPRQSLCSPLTTNWIRPNIEELKIQNIMQKRLQKDNNQRPLIYSCYDSPRQSTTVPNSARTHRNGYKNQMRSNFKTSIEHKVNNQNHTNHTQVGQKLIKIKRQIENQLKNLKSSISTCI